MAVIEYTIDPKGKCVSCKDYEYENDYWLCGKCKSETTKVRNKRRQYNDKACVAYRYDSENKLFNK